MSLGRAGSSPVPRTEVIARYSIEHDETDFGQQGLQLSMLVAEIRIVRRFPMGWLASRLRPKRFARINKR